MTANNDTNDKRLAHLLKVLRRYVDGAILSNDELQLLKGFEISPRHPLTNSDYLDAFEEGRHVIEQTLQRRHRHVEKKVRLLRVLAVAASVAALVVVAGFGFYFYRASLASHLVTLAAGHTVKAYRLADGTTVSLNRGSSITYDRKQFNRYNRHLTLSGEAFFQVAKNPEIPFTVYANHTQTTVRGTSFNVKAYASLVENVVSVREGSVEVTDNNRSVLATLTPGQQLTFNSSTHKQEVQDIDWRDAAGWTDGRQLEFNGASLDEIALQSRLCYGLQMDLARVKRLHLRLNGTYPAHDGGRTLLRDLRDIYGLHHTLKGRRVTLYKE